MNVFFRFSPRSSRDNALHIYEAIQSLGHTHVSHFIDEADPKTFYVDNEDHWAKRYVHALKELDRADVVIIETSIPSTAMGQLAQIAVEKFKPTILLYQKGCKPYFFQGLAGTEKRVQLLEYSLETLPEVLTYAFSFADEYINTRFTLLMPPDIMAHLSTIKKSGKSQSEYIRSLIRKDIKQ